MRYSQNSRVEGATSVGAVEQGHLAQGEQKQGDDLVFSLHNVHMEYAGVHMELTSMYKRLWNVH